MITILDPHIHLFNLAEGHYHWLAVNNPPAWPDKHVIAKNFTENNLTLTAPLNLAGFVHIEAGFDNHAPWREIAWLESHCTLPFRSVAGLDLTLTTQSFNEQLSKLTQFTSVIGIRHILDEQANTLLNDTTVIENFQQLNELGFNFDVQMPVDDPRAVAALIRVIEHCPRMAFIINHAGFPPLHDASHNTWQRWQQGLAKLAQLNNVAIKCSGWEMSDRRYSFGWPNQVIEHCLNLFGAKRVMLASNFPLTLFSCSYHDYWQQIINHVSAAQLTLLCKTNTEKWYKLLI